MKAQAAEAFESVEEFLDWLQIQGARYELDDGRVVAMAGGSRLHALVARRLLVALDQKLTGTGCEAFHGDLALRTLPKSVRLPDVTIYCDREELDGDPSSQRVMEKPRVVFEVLSPSTASVDQVTKLVEYKTISSLDTIVFVHPTKRFLDVHERVSDTEWRSVTHLHPSTLRLRDPRVDLTAEEIFGSLTEAD